IIAAAMGIAEKTGLPPGIIVVDTLARAIAGGDDNSSVDMGVFVNNCGAVQEATGATVLIVHHSGKDAAKGARGHSSLQAATDTEIEIKDEALTVTKQRDMGKDESFKFKLRVVEIGRRDDG